MHPQSSADSQDGFVGFCGEEQILATGTTEQYRGLVVPDVAKKFARGWFQKLRGRRVCVLLFLETLICGSQKVEVKVEWH